MLDFSNLIYLEHGDLLVREFGCLGHLFLNKMVPLPLINDVGLVEFRLNLLEDALDGGFGFFDGKRLGASAIFGPKPARHCRYLRHLETRYGSRRVFARHFTSSFCTALNIP